MPRRTVRDRKPIDTQAVSSDDGDVGDEALVLLETMMEAIRKMAAAGKAVDTKVSQEYYKLVLTRCFETTEKRMNNFHKCATWPPVQYGQLQTWLDMCVCMRTGMQSGMLPPTVAKLSSRRFYTVMAYIVTKLSSRRF